MARRLATNDDLKDGSLRGRTGPLAKVNLSDVPTFAYGGTGASSFDAQDGGVGGTSLFVTAAGLPNGGAIGAVVRATAVGIRAKREAVAARAPIDLIVDGRCVEAFRTAQPRINGVTAGTFQDFESSFEWPWALNLTDHTIIARIDANLDGTTVNTAIIAGLLLPRSDGFRDVSSAPRKGRVAAASAPTTAGTTITAVTDTATVELRVSNTNATGYTVYVYDASNTLYTTFAVPTSTTGSVGGTSGQTIPGIGVFIFPAPLNLNGWKWKTDVAPTTALTAQTRNV